MASPPHKEVPKRISGGKKIIRLLCLISIPGKKAKVITEKKITEYMKKHYQEQVSRAPAKR